LDQHNIAPSATEDSDQRRVITFNCTISGDFRLVCTAIKFADRNFDEFKEKPRVYRLNTEGLYVMLHHPDLDDTLLNAIINKFCIIVEAEKHQKITRKKCTEWLNAIILDGDNVIEVADTWPPTNGDGIAPETIVTAPAIDPDSESAAILDRIVLAQDGMYYSTEALLNDVNDYCKRKGKNIFMIKYAGGSSMTQSANDTGKMHLLLKQCFASKAFWYDDPPDMSDLSAYKGLQGVLKDTLDPSSYRTVWKCICNASLFLSKAFHPMNIRSAFATSGTVPFNPGTIMNVSPTFRSLPQEEADYVMGLAPILGETIQQKGYVPESTLDELFAEHPLLNDVAPKKGKPLNDMVTNRQRAMVMNNETYLEERQMKQCDKEGKEMRKRLREADATAEGEVAAAPKKRKQRKQCKNPTCLKHLREDADKGTKCPHKNCRYWFCNSCCAANMLPHRRVCSNRPK